MLPAEMIDWIFTFLQRDHDALKSCSAAHPLLSSLAERHLFVHIIFYVGFSSSHPGPTDGFLVSRLSRCLAEKPYLVNHIRSITIDGSAFSHPPLKTFKELSTLLPLIPRSERVSLRHVGWFEFPPPFRSALLHCLRTPRMKQICLHNSHNFPFTEMNFKAVKNLSLGSSGSSFKCHPEHTTSLESLSLVDVDLVRYIAWAASNLKSLTSLHVKAKCQPFPDLSPIFTSCLGSLTSLTLDIGAFCTSIVLDPQETSTPGLPSTDRTPYRRGIHAGPWGLAFPFNLSKLASLEVVTIHAMLGAGKYPFQTTTKVSLVKGCNSSLPVITKLVASARPSLNHVILNLDFRVHDGVSYLHDGMEWQPLIRFCDSLRHVRVDLCIRASTLGVWRSFAEVVDSLVKNEGLSGLVERGSLVIKPFPLDF